MGFAFIPLYIKYLGIESYGLIGIFTLLQAWLTLLDVGMTPTISREMARYKAGVHTSKSILDLLKSLEFICVFLALLIGLAIWSSSGWLASDWLRSNQLPVNVVAHAISVMALVVALRFCEGIYRSALLGLQEQVWYNVAHAVISTLRYGGAVVILVSYSQTIKAFFYWQAVVSFLSLVLFSWKIKSTIPKPETPAAFSTRALDDVWLFAGGIMTITFLKLVLTQVDKILLSKILSLENFAYYTLAATVSAVLLPLIGPIIQAFYPRMVQLVVDGDEVQLADNYHLGAQLVTVISSSGLFLLGFFAKNVIFMWSGDVNLSRNVGPILSILVVGSFLNGLMWIPYQCQLAHGWVKLGIRINAVAVCLLIPGMFWVVPKYGAEGAAWMWATLNAIYVFVGIHFMHTRLLPGEKWKWYGLDVLLPSAGSIAVLMVSSIFQPESSAGPIQWFLFLLTSGAFCIVVSAFLSNKIRIRGKQLLASINF